ncbi:folate family ECF transporter S component [Companilactobacillus mishanensis]|uniref:folate family ECF transporter S component n=1 Tax=Companilactobacillus mishanensis TaxID=2486008 RepID=UPI001297CFD6|nr:folate family ECF transporter S component [Companilactobacillus mishanensis]MQS89336.1 folate family ECF transporter S component [Companilactobacillus mishanensis]
MNRTKSTSITVHELTWMALLIAMQMVLSKLSVGSGILQVGFSFIAIGLMGYYFGPIKAMFANAAADIIANVLLPTGGGFFWGFTLSALVAGLIYGFMLYNRKVTLLNVFLTVLLITVVINTLMNTFWISMMTHNPFWVMLLTRLPKEGISLIYQTGILYFILKWVSNTRFNKIGR